MFRKARQVGGFWKLWRAMRSKNACKTCALGMGGQQGGMVNEAGHFPEVCKKSLQAMAADMQGGIRDDFYATYSLPQLQAFSPRELEHCGRITSPLLLTAGQQYYRAISWEEAFERTSSKLRATAPDETFWYFSGRSSNEAGFLLQLFARLYGTNNVNNCSYYCHQASSFGLASALGVGTATVTLDDVEQADVVFVIGGNPASNHPRLMRTLMNVRRHAGQVIVINPVVETGMTHFSVPSDVRSLLFGSSIATHYVQPHIGGDLALLTGIAKRIVELEATDGPFLAAHCDSWPTLQEHLQRLSWDEICHKSGVSRGEIDTIARVYAAGRRVVFTWTMGITHHVHGVENVQAIVNLALLRGMVGRAGAGLLPIRGHSNVQGTVSVGVTPKLKDAVFDRLQSHFKVQLSRKPGLDPMASMEAAAAGKVKVAVCLGGNLYGANPHAEFGSTALGKVDLLVYLSTTLNTGHAHGLGQETIILPVLARDEEPQSTTQESMFNFVRLSDGGPARHVGPRSEIAIVAELALRVLGQSTPIDWNHMADTKQIRAAIAEIVPGWQKIGEIDRTRQEFHIQGRHLATPEFPTKSGKAQIFVHELPELAGGPGELRLMTVRSEGQFNTVVYEEDDVYRGQDRRDVVLVHPDDLAQRGIEPDTRVNVHSSVGALNGVLARAYGSIKPGNALMYFPEANALVPRTLDPQSRTPAFKNVLVTLEPAKVGLSGARVAPVLAEIGVNGGGSDRANMRAC
jgi:molybdopterin-dependent oxidoreductase alpha subunit